MFRKPKQFSFFKPSAKDFGGSKLKGNPREKRTLSVRHPIHLVMRSKHAVKDWSFLAKQNRRTVDSIVAGQAKKLGIKLYGYVNVGNHLHMNLLIPSRAAYKKFVRAIAGLIPRAVMGCERGRAMSLQKFWDARPFTRIISWGREFSSIKKYFALNRLEAIGFVRPHARALLESSS
jgi:hypothetical protein